MDLAKLLAGVKELTWDMADGPRGEGMRRNTYISIPTFKCPDNSGYPVQFLLDCYSSCDGEQPENSIEKR